jgi:uncharacterized membrane protein
MTTTLSQPKAALGTIWRKGTTAAVIAAIVNGVLFFVGSAAGAFPATVITPMGTPITLAAVLISSVVGILVGTLGYTILNWLTANPNRWFTILAVIVLILFAYNPFTLAGAPMLMIVFLEIMHLVAGGAILYFLTRA